MKQKTSTVQAERIVDAAPVISVGEDNSVFASLAATLAEIRKLKGVMGYILRSNTAAIIDLTPKESIIEYAMLSSQIHASGMGIAKQFNLTDIESVLVEGKTAKVVLISIGENRLSIFMDKTCDHAWIVKRILL